MRATLVVPHLAPDTVARALVAAAPAGDSVVAVLIPVAEAGATAVIFRNSQGEALKVDMDRVASHLSTGGTDVGVAHGHSQDTARRWDHYREGQVVHTLGPRDELYLPMDEDGFPDLEATARTTQESLPAGWGRFRSCHDLGMQETFSCRFGPVAHCIDRMLVGEDVGARAYALVRDGQRLSPPPALSWTSAGVPR